MASSKSDSLQQTSNDYSIVESMKTDTEPSASFPSVHHQNHNCQHVVHFPDEVEEEEEEDGNDFFNSINSISKSNSLIDIEDVATMGGMKKQFKDLSKF